MPALFVVGSDTHHVEMAAPVMVDLRRRGHRVAALSICEMKGMRTPRRAFADRGLQIRRALPVVLGGGRLKRTYSRSREAKAGRILQSLAWYGGLYQLFLWSTSRARTVVVLPNDTAYPYDQMAASLRRRAVPFVLLQEGIRFPLPAEVTGRRFGEGGAARIAAWGEHSARHFRSLGLQASLVVPTGTPRYDALFDMDWERRGRAARKRLGLPDGFLLFLSNQVEAQGFVSEAQKLAAIRKLADSALRATKSDLVFKLHPGEQKEEFRRALQGADGTRIRITKTECLTDLIAACIAAIVMGSSTGLEVLIAGRPLGVMALPGAGFLFDFVSAGVARGLGADRALDRDLVELVGAPKGPSGPRHQEYLAHHLVGPGATARVADLVEELL